MWLVGTGKVKSHLYSLNWHEMSLFLMLWHRSKRWGILLAVGWDGHTVLPWVVWLGGWSMIWGEDPAYRATFAFFVTSWGTGWVMSWGWAMRGHSTPDEGLLQRKSRECWAGIRREAKPQRRKQPTCGWWYHSHLQWTKGNVSVGMELVKGRKSARCKSRPYFKNLSPGLALEFSGRSDIWYH